jgi:hypothetical protein
VIAKNSIGQKNSPGQRDDGKDCFVATVQSGRYNLQATVSLLREQIRAAYGRLHTVGTMVSGVIALGIIAASSTSAPRRATSSRSPCRPRRSCS